MKLKLYVFLATVFISFAATGQKINKAKLFGQWETTGIQKANQNPVPLKRTHLLTFYTNDYMVRSSISPSSHDTVHKAFKLWHIQRDEFALSHTELDSNIYIIRALSDSILKITHYNPFEGQMPDVVTIYRRKDTIKPGAYPHKITNAVPFLINTLDTAQKIRIKGESGIFHLTFSKPANDSVFIHHIYGDIKSIQDSTLKFLVKEKNVELWQNNKLISSARSEHKAELLIRNYNLNQVQLQFEESKKHSSKTGLFIITNKEDLKSKDHWYYKKLVIDLYPDDTKLR